MKNTALACFALAALASAGCSNGDSLAGTGAPGTATKITSDETWSGEKKLEGKISIEPGATVTIAEGARLVFGKDAFLTVAGTLKASASKSHAKLYGDKWGGLIVVEGGTATLSGVDIDGPIAALDVQGGAAVYEDGAITWPGTPFRVLERGQLTMKNATVANANGISRIKGSLTATKLQYDTLADTGIQADAQGAKVVIEDSVLKGHGAPTDVVVATAGLVKISYSDISDAHCGLHFFNVNEIDVSNVTIHDVSYGAMLYGSTAGQKLSIANVNFERAEDFGVHEADGSQNGPVTLTNVFFGDDATDTYLQPGSRIQIQKAGGRINGAAPR